LHLDGAELEAGRAAWEHSTGMRDGILVHLGATHPDKEWPHAPAFAAALRHRGRAAALSTVPARPQPTQHAAAASGLPCLPPVDLRRFLAIVAAARAVVSVDGAIVHAAVALGRPTVALFGPTDAAVWFPYGGFGPYCVLRAAAACAPCNAGAGPHTCMAALEPARVLAALDSVLGEAG
jgi:ADP-heptose:LPS heptosyltransferase